jgi:putative cell wall-binding protein
MDNRKERPMRRKLSGRRGRMLIAILTLTACLLIGGTTQAYAAESNVSRYGGEDRYETAVEISKKTFPGTADTVVLAYGGRFSDSLSGSGLAGITTASPLLTDIDTLPAVTATEITRLSPSKVYVLGGTAAISEGVTEQVRALPSKPEIVRLAGLDRYATARIIAEEIIRLGGSTTEAYIACGASFADSAILSSFSASQTVPILLADDEGLSAEAAAFIEANAISDVTIAGGTAAVPSQTEAQLATLGVANVKRHGGTDRYDTCEKLVTALIDKYDLTVFLIGVAVGESDRFADALTGGTSAGIRGGVVVISPSDSSDFVTRVVVTLSGGGKPLIEIYGKEGALSQTIEQDLAVVVSRPNPHDPMADCLPGDAYLVIREDGKLYHHGIVPATEEYLYAVSKQFAFGRPAKEVFEQMLNIDFKGFDFEEFNSNIRSRDDYRGDYEFGKLSILYNCYRYVVHWGDGRLIQFNNNSNIDFTVDDLIFE